jgi:hypothetical protein
MGAWGPKAFDNDAAADFLDELEADGPPRIAAALRSVIDAPPDAYLDVDDCSAAIAAAELVYASKRADRSRLDDAAGDWLDEHSGFIGDTDLVLARQAVDRVLAKSELRDLWDEAGPDSEWHADVRALRDGLFS